MAQPQRAAMAPTDDDDEPPALLDALIATALLPYRTLVSNTAKRAYVRALLLGLAALALAGIAGLAYIFFAYAYIPQLGFARPVHLQFEPPLQTDVGPLPYPFGVATIARGELVAAQGYDVRVRLHMPRAPVNLEAGNFMVDVRLDGDKGEVAHAARPAILKWKSDLVQGASRVAGLGVYVAGWRTESEVVDVGVFEGVSFAKGGVPRSLRVELRSEARLWVYECEVQFRAKFRGLRWLMYNFPITSFVAVSSMFWLVEMGAMLIIWAVCSTALSSSSATTQATVRPAAGDTEASEAMSSTSRQFPSSSKSPSLRYSASAVKSEPGDDDRPIKEEDDDAPPAPLEPTAAEADDEDDEDADFMEDDLPSVAPRGGFSDSGLGTSYESGAAADAMRRRKK